MSDLASRIRLLVHSPLTWLVTSAMILSLYVAEPLLSGDLGALPIVVLAAASITVAVVGIGWASVVVCTRFLPTPAAGVALLVVLLAFTHLLLPRIGAGVLWIAFHFVVIPIFCAVLGLRCVVVAFRQRSVDPLLIAAAVTSFAVLGITLYDPQWVVRFLNLRLK